MIMMIGSKKKDKYAEEVYSVDDNDKFDMFLFTWINHNCMHFFLTFLLLIFVTLCEKIFTTGQFNSWC